jgi:beta-lactamase regulating signal transducer with metallopeptidase domain
MTRFAVWFATLLVIAGLPLLTLSDYGSAPSNLRVPELMLSSVWASRLFVAWAVIAGALLVRLGFSLSHIYRLRRGCRRVENATLAEVAAQLPHRRVRLLVSDDLRVPAALGFFRPAVVLPAWTLRELSTEELKVIVLHELAHLRRWDDWTNLAQKFVKALFFFHPAVWWIDSRLSLEREIACDDLVLQQTSSARAYAGSLISLSEKMLGEKLRMAKAFALAQGALGRMREVSVRVTRILESEKRPRSHRGWLGATAMIGTLAVMTVAAMPYAPELVSFQQPRVQAFSRDSGLSRSVSNIVIPARWTGEDTHALSASQGHALAQKPRHPAVKHDAQVIPANATQRSIRRPHSDIFLTKASAQRQPSQTLLVLRSTQVDDFGMPLWTFSVWRVSSPNGQTVQEMFVMNSI